MVPSVERIVHYTISNSQALQINTCTGNDISNPASEGEVFPMIITKIFDNKITENSAVNGQIFIDGNFTLWITSSIQGSGINQWFDPRA